MPGSKRLCSDAVDSAVSPNSSDASRLSYSQPGLGFFSGSQPVHQNDDNEDEDPNNHLPGAVFSFSQPAHIDDMLLNSQLNTQTASGSSMSSPLQRLVKRMTRLVAKVSCEEAIKHLSQQLVKLGYTWKIHTPGVVRNRTLILVCINSQRVRSLSRLPFQHKTGVKCSWFLRPPSMICRPWFY